MRSAFGGGGSVPNRCLGAAHTLAHTLAHYCPLINCTLPGGGLSRTTCRTGLSISLVMLVIERNCLMLICRLLVPRCRGLEREGGPCPVHSCRLCLFPCTLWGDEQRLPPCLPVSLSPSLSASPSASPSLSLPPPPLPYSVTDYCCYEL